MQLSNIPGKLILPFANAGGKNTIPVASQIGITAGAASLTDGFPPLTRTPIAAGGIPPSGLDMNGVLYELSAILRWANAGGGYPYDGAFAVDANVNGYPKGAKIMRTDGAGYWLNTVENNVTDPESSGSAAAGWVPDFAPGVAAITMTSANVTLTPLQYGKPVIIVSGVMTSDLNLIFPVIAGEWVVINNTTGSKTITAKTTSGTGVAISSSFVGNVICDGTNVYSRMADLLAIGGSSLVGYRPVSGGTYPSNVETKLRECVSIEDFRIFSDGANETALVQRAFDSGKPIKFTKSYSVNSVIASTIGGYIDFNGFGLIGIQAAGGQYVFGITGRYMNLFRVNVSANFLPYAACVRWFSVNAGSPAQYNNVYGITLSYCSIGLLFGQEIGTPSVDAAQSENTIYGFTCRGLQTPFVGNQSNGFITLVSPVLDCNPYEWSTQPGFNATTWNTAALVLNNIVGQLVTVGGEMLKTATQLGYGLRGLGVVMLSPVLEIAGAQGYIMGDFVIRDNTNGYMASDSASAFTIDAAATGALRLYNPLHRRGASVGSYSGAPFINYLSATNAFDVWIEGGSFLEWEIVVVAGRTVNFRDVSFTEATGAATRYAGKSLQCLQRERGTDTSIYTTTGWYLGISYGGGTTMTIAADGPSGRLAASLALNATGVAWASTVDVTSAATIKATGVRVAPGEIWRFEAYLKKTSGSNSTLQVNFYDIAGALIGSPAAIATPTASWAHYVERLGVPALAAFMEVRLYGEVSVSNITDLKVIRLAEIV